ncbi:hypothetical protein SAMN05192529_10781 [Arachidicoccus rhizosphaerae]|jgi:hypothetical protein|uniref:CCDC81-like prokaryotic HU domain-containing protein n=1 Tax=Arachidicoccus rhizosphaerae TaxID=551991 RepID=A0A1H3Y3B0_9BACT|nr:hypothetical protein [Arachidicoccus rhizosphaerae]SEA06139.1 hypothetical protein SAMN05192529_10781 [Arachidicoccus rhizosphaerae]
MPIDFSLLQRFLISHKRLPLGKLGTVILEEQQAFHEYTSSVIRPASEVLQFSPKTDNVLQQEFESFVVKKGGTIDQVKELSEQIKQQLSQSKQVVLEGIGTLKIENNIYKIFGEDLTAAYLAPVAASAVVHEGDVHDVKVGEQVHSSEEMKALLQENKSKDYWWVYALILVVVAIAAILYYLYGDQLK